MPCLAALSALSASGASALSFRPPPGTRSVVHLLDAQHRGKKQSFLSSPSYCRAYVCCVHGPPALLPRKQWKAPRQHARHSHRHVRIFRLRRAGQLPHCPTAERFQLSDWLPVDRRSLSKGWLLARWLAGFCGLAATLGSFFHSASRRQSLVSGAAVIVSAGRPVRRRAIVLSLSPFAYVTASRGSYASLTVTSRRCLAVWLCPQ